MKIFFQSWFNCHNNTNHKNNIMGRILLRSDSSRSSFILFSLPFYLHLRNSSYSWISRCRTSHPGSRWHPSPGDWALGAECGRIEMSVSDWEISGFVIVKRRVRVKARLRRGPDITLLQRNIISIRHLDTAQPRQDDISIRAEEKDFCSRRVSTRDPIIWWLKDVKGLNNIIIMISLTFQDGW